MERIEGRVAFITGAAGGIGLAIAEALIDAGAKVVIADVDAAELDAQAARLGSNAAAFKLDVTDRARWAEAKSFVEARFGPVDILVNNAGIGPDLLPLAEVPPERFDLLVRIKLTGTFNGIHSFAADMRARGEGHIVNTASMAGLTASARLGAYTSAKFAVVGMTEVLRLELAPFGVGASVLCPGMVRTRLRQTTRAVLGEAPVDAETAPAQGISASQTALDPAEIGRLVVEGIRADRLYILSHAEYRDRVAARMTGLLDAFDALSARG